ncbi:MULTISPECIES: hypothetical protein [Helicobacter]|uniref:Uncharacterized protein n=1 Tax=Helicobacter trogontum TaxID=50960 RepID=A0A4U8TFF6_9HELI|nr:MULTISPECIES: hypothetical protein [Helicobacter]MCI7048033.1 hypothetical protein [Helicobacter sp.]MDY4427113.1 hypothetical protein [Helicobacter sp.]MDY5616549.1 hypothetical protein [Helicobacter sp.]TLD98128.1 hypothetical protein LS80_005780 [Helicobacter trogontum]
MFELEKELQDEILHNISLQKDICINLDIDFKKCKFIAEDTYINGITADFSIFEDNEVRAIVECKGGKINLTDYVRGIGQIFQYEFFAEEHLSIKNYKFTNLNNFSSVLIFPDSVLRNNDFNIGLFKYPKSKKILEINSKNLALRQITEKELQTLRNSKIDNLKVISQYYIRDNRLFELYFLLKILMIYKLKNKKVHRVFMWQDNGLLQKLKTPNNRNWRNAFISLSSLGFIDKNNYPTQSGVAFANMEFAEFALMVFNSYLKPYYDLIFKALQINNNVSNKELSDNIKQAYNTKADILFLTQSHGRYISSWLNIARDDFAIIDFKARDTQKNFLLNPFEVNNDTFLQHIKKYSKINDYLPNFESVYNEI